MLSPKDRIIFILKKFMPIAGLYAGMPLVKVVNKYLCTKGVFNKANHSYGRNMGNRQASTNHKYFISVDSSRIKFKDLDFLTLKLLAGKKSLRSSLFKLACNFAGAFNITLNTLKDILGSFFKNLTKKPKNYGDSSRVSQFASGSQVIM